MKTCIPQDPYFCYLTLTGNFRAYLNQENVTSAKKTDPVVLKVFPFANYLECYTFICVEMTPKTFMFSILNMDDIFSLFFLNIIQCKLKTKYYDISLIGTL